MNINVSTCTCDVCMLLNQPFSRLSMEEKNNFIKKERPVPIVDIKKQAIVKGKTYERHFKPDNYLKFTWLTSCIDRKKLFCWPCLFFASIEKDKSVWTTIGYDDLTHFHAAASKHEKTHVHINSIVSMKLFGQVRIDLQLDQQKRTSLNSYNEAVTKNRNIMKRFIDVVCLLGLQEIAFRGHDESLGSNNRGNYVEIIQFLAKYDESLSNHITTSSVFSGLSNRIQNDLIQSVSNVLINEIKKEVFKCNFVAIMLDETSDISHKSQLALILRYVLNGQPFERFIGFYDVSADRSAQALSQFVKNFVDLWGFGKKLIAQTYDGAAVMSGALNGTQKLVRDAFPLAIFIHCFAHNLNLVLSKSVSFIKECKIFFSSISGLTSFFSNSTKRNYALDAIVHKKFPKVAPTRWNYFSRTVNTVKEYWEPLCELFDDILENPENWDGETILLSRGFLAFLQNFNTVFLLNVFSEIFGHTDILYDIIQKKNCEINFVIHQVENTKNKLVLMREEFEIIFEKTDNIVSMPTTLRKKRGEINDPKIYIKRVFNEILDTICLQINERFKKLPQLKFLGLFDIKAYPKYIKDFPNDILDSLKDSYGNFFDFVKLKNELNVIYASESLKEKTVLELIIYIQECGLTEALSEAFKLTDLILTIPYSTAGVERTFSALKRIKSYSRNTIGQDRLSSLGLISIERNLLKNTQVSGKFYDDVLNDFVQKERRIDLIYK